MRQERTSYVDMVRPYRNGCVWRGVVFAAGRFGITRGCCPMPIIAMGDFERRLLDELNRTAGQPVLIEDITQEELDAIMRMPPCQKCGGTRWGTVPESAEHQVKARKPSVEDN